MGITIRRDYLTNTLCLISHPVAVKTTDKGEQDPNEHTHEHSTIGKDCRGIFEYYLTKTNPTPRIYKWTATRLEVCRSKYPATLVNSPSAVI